MKTDDKAGVCQLSDEFSMNIRQACMTLSLISDDVFYPLVPEYVSSDTSVPVSLRKK